MLANTEALAGLVGAEAAGFEIGPLPLDAGEPGRYAPSRWLRAAAPSASWPGLGCWPPLPRRVGLLAAGAVAALGRRWPAGLDWDALALIAALVFPVLGYGRPLREGCTGTDPAGGAWRCCARPAVSLVGATLLVAVGSDRASVLGIEPFRGVAATLVVPPALFLAHAMLRERGPAGWLRTLWTQPIRLGPARGGRGGRGGALALVVVRRGNTPIIGASELELEIREALASAVRAAALQGAARAPAGTAGADRTGWPEWIRAPLLTGGVIAQASILNSFAHYHTPLASRWSARSSRWRWAARWAWRRPAHRAAAGPRGAAGWTQRREGPGLGLPRLQGNLGDEAILAGLARGLAARGHAVQALSGAPAETRARTAVPPGTGCATSPGRSEPATRSSPAAAASSRTRPAIAACATTSA